MESDASPPSPNSSVSFRVPLAVTQYEHRVQEEEDTEDVVEDQEPEGQIQDSIAAHKPKRTTQKLSRYSNMLMAYALPVEAVENSVPSTFKKVELSSESEL